MEDGAAEIARLDLYGIYMEIREEDVAGLQSALRSRAYRRRRRPDGVRLPAHGSSRKTRSRRPMLASERRVVGKTPDDAMDDLSGRSDAAADGQHARS